MDFTKAFSRVIDRFPELLLVAKPGVTKTINYGEYSSDLNFLTAVLWIYKFYFNYSIVLFLPKRSYSQIFDVIDQFNDFIGDKWNLEVDISGNNSIFKINIGDLESIERFDTEIVNCKQELITIFGNADSIFYELSVINKRRLNTQLRAISKKCHVQIFSVTNLSLLDLVGIDNFEYSQLQTKYSVNLLTVMDYISFIDLIDEDDDIFESNVENLAESIQSFVEQGKRIYMSLNLPTEKLLMIESEIKRKKIKVSRKESPSHQVIMNSTKTTTSNGVIDKYDIYIMVWGNIAGSLEVIPFMDPMMGNNDQIEIIMDSSKFDILESCLKRIHIGNGTINTRVEVKDSMEFDTYELALQDIEDTSTDQEIEVTMATEEYYQFEANDQIKRLNLSNLEKKDYDTIRNFVKIKLINKLDINIRTCQLSAPCSPIDRSRKLNSLSNKVSSFDYRCDVTCEIFKDYTIGVIVWNDFFADRKKLDLNLMKNQTYIYQTTKGTWKYSVVH